jgi:hypothetical protein
VNRALRFVGAVGAALLVIVGAGCPSPFADVRPRARDLQTGYELHHESLYYRVEHGHFGLSDYRRAYAHHDWLYFCEEFDGAFTDGIPAFVAFVHHEGTVRRHNFIKVAYWDEDGEIEAEEWIEEADVTPSRPSITLDGRAITDGLIASAPIDGKPDSRSVRYLRIRPGLHRLRVSGWRTVVDRDGSDGLVYGDDSKMYLETFDEDVEVRAGDVCVVETGLVPERPTAFDDTSREEFFAALVQYRYGCRIVVLEREKLMPRIPSQAYPEAGELVRESQRRADAGDPAAIHDLGVRTLFAIGLPQDTWQAKEHFLRAAELGYPRSMAMLGDYETLQYGARGRGRLFDPARLARAKEWYLRALDAGDAAAGARLLRDLGLRGSGASGSATETQSLRERILARLRELDAEPLGVPDEELIAYITSRAR